MLEDLEKTECFEAPKLGASDEESGKSPLLEQTGTMRSLFEETASEHPGDDDVTVEMPDSESPTVEMRADTEATAELPAVDNDDTAAEDVVDVDITDLESLSRQLADNDDDRMSATLTQALDLLEQDYEDELTQSQILEKQQFAAALRQGRED